MAILNIRNLPEKVHSRLRVRAAQAGRSMEAEARAILTNACLGEDEKKPAAALQGLVDQLYSGVRPEAVVEGLLNERRREVSEDSA